MRARKSGCDTSSAIASRKGLARYGGHLELRQIRANRFSLRKKLFCFCESILALRKGDSSEDCLDWTRITRISMRIGARFVRILPSVGFWAFDPNRFNLHIPLLYSESPLTSDLGFVYIELPSLEGIIPKGMIPLALYNKLLCLCTALRLKGQVPLTRRRWERGRKVGALIEAPTQPAGGRGPPPFYLLVYLFTFYPHLLGPE